ncbi:T9SS type A sorting domain-containing protein [Hymenobacter algoricola]|uniref:T9SS type A sorting domain-containing protein n=1 Tax=Hymenobacter algoricola TaxID=486267 RepID=UPI0031E4E73C
MGNVTFSSPGATTQNVGVSGTGVLPTPVLTVNPTALAFGTTTVGAATPSQPFTVSGSSLQGNVTITAPNGFQIRTGTGFFSGAPITLTPSNGTLANTTIDVRFIPGTTGAFNDVVGVSTPNGTGTISNNVTVTGNANPTSGRPSIMATPNSLAFGTVTSSGSTNAQTFEVSGTDLNANLVLTPSSPNVQIRNASAGGSFSSSPLSIMPMGGTVTPQIIEVRLVALVAQGSFNERIDLTSAGANPQVVSITANNPSGATSDISVSNPSNNSFTFVTRPSTFSASQSFLVAGTNLVQPLVVFPAGPNANFFQVSSDNVNFSSSVSFTPDNQGNVTQRPIFVRFVPGVNAVTVTSTIRNSSAPAPDFDVSVTGISEPTIRLDSPIGPFATNVVKGTETAPKTVKLEGFLLSGDVELRFPPDATDAVRNPTQTPLFQYSLDGGLTYQTSGGIITPDANGNFSLNLLVRFAPVRVGNAAQELQFRNASFNNNEFFALSSGFGRTTGFGIAVEPTAQSTATVVRSADGTMATITFDLSNPGTGAFGQNRAVIGSSTYLTTLPPNLFPADKQNFNPGTTNNGAYVYGTGTEIEASTNTYVVFSGSNNSFTVTNLNPALQYNFYGFEFNNDGVLNAENYLTPNNQPQFPLPVELVAFSGKLRNNSVVLNWSTASEKNNKSFEVQRSQSGKPEDYTTVLTKEGAGNATSVTKYEAVDARPLAGVSYYRLKQTDLDGTVSISKAVVIRATLGDVSLFPNPTQGDVTIQLPEGSTENLSVRITDLTGRQVQVGRLAADGKLNTSNLKAGTYIVIVGEGAQTVTRKMVKN